MTDKEKNEEAEKQLKLLQKMLDDATKLLGDIHTEMKARKSAKDKEGS